MKLKNKTLLDKFQKEFFRRYKDVAPAVLAMMWIDIEEFFLEIGG